MVNWSFALWKSKRIKRQTSNWEKDFVTTYPKKSKYPDYINNVQNQKVKKPKNLIRK